jgi:hypothetical protein
MERPERLDDNAEDDSIQPGHWKLMCRQRNENARWAKELEARLHSADTEIHREMTEKRELEALARIKESEELRHIAKAYRQRRELEARSITGDTLVECKVCETIFQVKDHLYEEKP